MHATARVEVIPERLGARAERHVLSSDREALLDREALDPPIEPSETRHSYSAFGPASLSAKRRIWRPARATSTTRRRKTIPRARSSPFLSLTVGLGAISAIT